MVQTVFLTSNDIKRERTDSWILLLWGKVNNCDGDTVDICIIQVRIRIKFIFIYLLITFVSMFCCQEVTNGHIWLSVRVRVFVYVYACVSVHFKQYSVITFWMLKDSANIRLIMVKTSCVDSHVLTGVLCITGPPKM